MRAWIGPGETGAALNIAWFFLSTYSEGIRSSWSNSSERRWASAFSRLASAAARLTNRCPPRRSSAWARSNNATVARQDRSRCRYVFLQLLKSGIVEGGQQVVADELRLGFACGVQPRSDAVQLGTDLSGMGVVVMMNTPCADPLLTLGVL